MQIFEGVALSDPWCISRDGGYSTSTLCYS